MSGITKDKIMVPSSTHQSVSTQLLAPRQQTGGLEREAKMLEQQIEVLKLRSEIHQSVMEIARSQNEMIISVKSALDELHKFLEKRLKKRHKRGVELPSNVLSILFDPTYDAALRKRKERREANLKQGRYGSMKEEEYTAYMQGELLLCPNFNLALMEFQDLRDTQEPITEDKVMLIALKNFKDMTGEEARRLKILGKAGAYGLIPAQIRVMSVDRRPRNLNPEVEEYMLANRRGDEGRVKLWLDKLPAKEQPTLSAAEVRLFSIVGQIKEPDKLAIKEPQASGSALSSCL